MGRAMYRLQPGSAPAWGLLACRPVRPARLIEFSTAALLRAKKKQRIDLRNEPRPVKVNLGSGLLVEPGWLNVDGSLNALVSTWPESVQSVLYRMSGSSRLVSREDYLAMLNEHRYIHHDLVTGIPFDDGSVDFVYSSHFLEHLTKADGDRLLAESYRVLRPGGTVRVAVPDLEIAVSMYGDGTTEEMLDHFFFNGSEAAGSFARHKYLYDFALLRDRLAEHGFTDIERFACGEGRTPDIDKLDNRPEETLFVEGTKP
jgi:predicted SAM-dependent methyltransferase